MSAFNKVGLSGSLKRIDIRWLCSCQIPWEAILRFDSIGERMLTKEGSWAEGKVGSSNTMGRIHLILHG